VLPLLLVFAVAASAVASPAPECPRVAPCCEHERHADHTISTPSCCHLERSTAPDAVPGTPAQGQSVSPIAVVRRAMHAVPAPSSPALTRSAFARPNRPRERQYLQLRQLLI
jgi:hypothetical protein